jgi:hypothetical protein
VTAPGLPSQSLLLGLGENGRLAFDDARVADFCDPERVKVGSEEMPTVSDDRAVQSVWQRRMGDV